MVWAGSRRHYKGGIGKEGGGGESEGAEGFSLSAPKVRPPQPNATLHKDAPSLSTTKQPVVFLMT